MSIHTKALKQACKDLKIDFISIGNTGIFLHIRLQSRNYHFIANQVPLDNSMVAAIAEDKGHSYDLLNNLIRMPKTLSFLDPDVRELYQPYVTHRSLKEIIQVCEKVFGYPFILKKNSGSQGTNVFKCSNREESINALQQIFDHHSIEYDHIALAQEYINIVQEYRVTILNKEIEIIYQKDNSQATFNGNLSPLHWAGARAILNLDPELKKSINTFIRPIFSVLDLAYGGLDIAINTEGTMCLFEINSHPAYDHLVQDTDIVHLVELYKKVLLLLSENN